MKAVCPGSFDPITSGHIDVIERAAKVFGEVIVAVGANPAKECPLFTVEERMDMIREATSHISNVRVDSFDCLLVDYAHKVGAAVIVKGLRAVSDFEFEFQMALTHRTLAPEMETAFLMTAPEYSYLSSSIVREIARLGGSVKGLVPEIVENRLREKFSKLPEVNKE